MSLACRQMVLSQFLEGLEKDFLVLLRGRYGKQVGWIENEADPFRVGTQLRDQPLGLSGAADHVAGFGFDCEEHPACRAAGTSSSGGGAYPSMQLRWRCQGGAATCCRGREFRCRVWQRRAAMRPGWR